MCPIEIALIPMTAGVPGRGNERAALFGRNKNQRHFCGLPLTKRRLLMDSPTSKTKRTTSEHARHLQGIFRVTLLGLSFLLKKKTSTTIHKRAVVHV